MFQLSCCGWQGLEEFAKESSNIHFSTNIPSAGVALTREKGTLLGEPCYLKKIKSQGQLSTFQLVPLKIPGSQDPTGIIRTKCACLVLYLISLEFMYVYISRELDVLLFICITWYFTGTV
jgi:hypothetical protein